MHRLFVPVVISEEKEAILYTLMTKRVPDAFHNVHLHSKTMTRVLGSQYRKYKELLNYKDLVTYRQSYSNGKGKGFTVPFALKANTAWHYVEITTSPNRRHCYREFSGYDNPLCKRVRSNVKQLALPQGDFRNVLQQAGLNSSVSITRGIANGGNLYTEFAGRVSQDKFAGRIHSPVSGLNRPLRAMLTIYGEPTVQVDAHASQAVLTALAAGDDHLLEMASAGEFWGPLKEANPHLTKDQIKKETYRQIYGGRSEILNAPYPVTATYITTKDGRELARTNQRLEKSIFIDGVLSELYRKSVFAVPIHDCILCRQEDAEMVRSAVTARWVSLTGFRPHLS